MKPIQSKNKKPYRFTLLGIVILFFLLLFGGCAHFGGKSSPGPKDALKKVSRFRYPRLTDDMPYTGLENAIDRSLTYLKRVSPGKSFTFGKEQYTAAHLILSLETFKKFIQTHPRDSELNNFIKKNFFIYGSTRNEGRKVLFTGYYEPTLQGSRFRTAVYRFPVYETPQDLISIDLSPFSPELKGKKITGRIDNNNVVPYFERKEIEDPSIFQGRAAPIAWVKDQTGLFFLQIQGSGIIILPDGDSIRVHYHASNGRPYRSIGKVLIDQGKILRKEMSMQKIRAYLDLHPDQQEAIFNTNPSYVFFKREEGGPYGCLNVELTPGRSAATDRKLFPEAALMFIQASKPLVDGDGKIHSWKPFSRFFLNQDTGGAIKGPGRCDLFLGSDPYAEIAAGHMKQEGTLYFLILKP